MLDQINNQRLLIAAVSALLAGAAHSASAAVINVPADQLTIQAAINASAPGDEVVVAPGTYVELINFNGKAITLRSTDPTDPAIVAATILDGNHNGPMVTCSSGEGVDTVLSGFLITGGEIPSGEGAGMRIVGGNPTVSHCTFRFNVARDGGGMYIENGNPMVTDCIFDRNLAISWGGGIFITSSDAMVTNCAFEGNQASSGGGIYNDESSPALSNCQFSGNTTFGSGGGGMETTGFSSDPVLTNCGFCFNTPTAVVGPFTNVGDTTSVAFCAAEPAGACCLPAGGCITATAPDCLAAGGSYSGNDVTCAAAGCSPPPPDPVPGDMNSDGVLDGEDIPFIVAALLV